MPKKKTKKPRKESINLKVQKVEFDLPYHFLIIFDSPNEVGEFRIELDRLLEKAEENKVFNYYRITPFDDICYYFHLDSLVVNQSELPDEVQLFTVKSFYKGQSISIPKKDLLYRQGHISNKESQKVLR